MAKNQRYQSVINRQSDEYNSENHWLRRFEEKLQKTSVQPAGQSLFEQINSIMNSKSKYPSVQAAVDDMIERSGLRSYLSNVKISEQDNQATTKIAAELPQTKNDDKLPLVIRQKPSILRTLENIIKETRGNIPVPAIISRLHSFHANDISDENAWEDERLIRLVSLYNLNAKKDNPGNFDSFNNLGQGDHGSSDSDIDPSNSDAFHALMPAKI